MLYVMKKHSRSSRNAEFDGRQGQGFTSDYETHFSSRSFHDVFSEVVIIIIVHQLNIGPETL